MNFFPPQQASRNVIEIYMLIHRADKAENRCFSYFCFALQMDSKRHKSPSCHSNALPGSLFVPNRQTYRTRLRSVSQPSSSLREEQKSEPPGISQDVTSASTDELRHNIFFAQPPRRDGFFLPIFDGGRTASCMPRGCPCSYPCPR